MSDVTDRARELARARARELADRLLDGNLEGKSFTEWIFAALQLFRADPHDYGFPRPEEARR